MGWKSLFTLRPLSKKEKEILEELKTVLNQEELKLVSKLKKQFLISLEQHSFNTKIVEDENFYLLKLKKPAKKQDEDQEEKSEEQEPEQEKEKPKELESKEAEKEVKKEAKIAFAEQVSDINQKITLYYQTKLFRKFSQKAFYFLSKNLAPNIVGLDSAKQSAVLQLFTTPQEPVHLLLLGDPGTGKTEILRQAISFAPKFSFGLGSGTSSAGLVVTVKGKEVQPGLLPLADEGICAIDELNLMKDDSRAGLYNAMEKGFITYDKGGHHYKFDSRISIIATANPKHDKFYGHEVREWKKQLPFDSALLTRFHLVFFKRKPGTKEFTQIAKNVIKGKKSSLAEKDKQFIKEYIKFAHQIKVKIPIDFEEKIIQFAKKIKLQEDKYLVEITPRTIVGITRLAKARARIELRDKVNEDDLFKTFEIVEQSLKI